jgi:hypothetical protein
MGPVHTGLSRQKRETITRFYSLIREDVECGSLNGQSRMTHRQITVVTGDSSE